MRREWAPTFNRFSSNKLLIKFLSFLIYKNLFQGKWLKVEAGSRFIESSLTYIYKLSETSLVFLLIHNCEAYKFY